MQTDFCGYETSLTSADAADNWNRMQLAFLAHGAETPTYLGRVLELETGFAMGHATKGLMCLMLGRREVTSIARKALADAERFLIENGALPRERLYVEALHAWIGGRPSSAVERMETVLADYPRDALAMKISHATRFILGDAIGMRRSVEALLPKWRADHPARGYLFGCHAFALEEVGEYERAEMAGRMGLSLAADDAWGLHAVAHVHDMTGNAVKGLDWLTGREEAWAHCNNFRYHVWWHKALMHLDLGQIDEVMALYDTEIRKDKTDDYRDISNASSLLSRLELNGIDIGDRWEELAEISAKRTEDGCLIFADLHYLLALIGGKRANATHDLMTRIRNDAGKSRTEAQRRMAKPGLSATAGLEAFGKGDYGTAFLNLAAARHKMQLAGGSHAQRDVFERFTIDAGIRAGYLDDAKAILMDRTTRRGGYKDGYAAQRMDLIADLTAERGGARVDLPAE